MKNRFLDGSIDPSKAVIRPSGKPEAAAARQYFDQVNRRIQGDATFYFVNVGPSGGWDAAWHQKETAWKGKDYSAARREIAAMIEKLAAKR